MLCHKVDRLFTSQMDPLRLHGGGGDTPSGRLTRTDSLDDYSARKLTRSDSVSDGYYRGSATISHASNGYIQMIERRYAHPMMRHQPRFGMS